MLEVILAWDVRLFRLINGEWHTPLLDQVLPFVSDWQNYQIPILVAALAVVAVGRLRGLRFVVLAVVSVLVADAIGAHLIKNLIGRPRPCTVLEDIQLLAGCTNSGSFPSNHAVNASVLATLVTLYAGSLFVPAALVAMLIAYSRVYVGVHYPLDVLAGGLLGIIVALILAWITAFMSRSLGIGEDTPPGGRRRIHTLKMGDR
ncbi:MAG TPA: phosphatase PAP2 family protein [Alphaproteobacteria bacterium]|nr:phosphatase PAP2 family protein [Alphaproteobacteria bacterium]